MRHTSPVITTIDLHVFEDTAVTASVSDLTSGSDVLLIKAGSTHLNLFSGRLSTDQLRRIAAIINEPPAAALREYAERKQHDADPAVSRPALAYLAATNNGAAP